MTQPTAPPGWYPVGDSERYWDGVAWTEHVRAPAPPAEQPNAGVVYDEHGLPHAAEPGAPWPAPPTSGNGWPPPAGYPYGTQQPNRHPTPNSGYYPNARPGAGFGYVQVPYGVAAKSPGLSLVASFFIPGLGSMINGDVAKGVGILFGYFFSMALAALMIGIPGLIAFWVWGMVDAYQGAKLWNARHGLIG